jgi:Protein of unknown function (DUF2490)
MLKNKWLFTCKLILVLEVGVIINANSQEVDHQLWVNYALNVPINNKLSYGGDIGLRGFISNYDWNQVLIRPTVTYRFNREIGVAGAIAWFRTANRANVNVNEFRIHQDLNLKWPDLGFMEFFYRVRTEERFFFYENNITTDFNVRLRALIGIESQDFNWFGSKRPIYFQGIYEGFRTLGDESANEVFINQVRIHVVFGQRLSKGFRYELHYIAQKSRLFLEDGLNVSQNIYRVRLFHRLTRKEK